LANKQKLEKDPSKKKGEETVSNVGNMSTDAVATQKNHFSSNAGQGAGNKNGGVGAKNS